LLHNRHVIMWRPFGDREREARLMQRCILQVVMLAVGFSGSCPTNLRAQQPILGGSVGGPASGSDKYHTGPNGKRCLTIVGSAKSQIINPDIYDHLVTASNACPSHIRARVCYYRSEHCISIDVPSYGRREEVLGVFPRLKDFRFEYKELF
jgi:hypothetical protein